MMTESRRALSQGRLLELLDQISTMGPSTTIIFSSGSVFEFKGSFPGGTVGHGFYNFGTGPEGFQGHLNIEKIASVELQAKQHRGREARSFNFHHANGDLVFKVFLGRDETGEMLPNQISLFENIKESA